MILYDFSSAIHRCIHTAIKHVNPHKENGKYKTDEFISTAIWRICAEFIEFHLKYHKEYGDFTICLDDHSKPYWRKAIYPDYKAQRKSEREKSDVNFEEVFKHLNLLTRVLKDYTNFKVIGVPGVEADDIIGLLTRKYAKFEKVLILSPDKDFKQLHSLGQIRQYSSITNKWIEPENVEEWKQEHICLGDAADNVPRIVDFIEFSEPFKMFLNQSNLHYDENSYFDLDFDSKSKIQAVFETNYPGEKVYSKPRFGAAALKKEIAVHGSLDNFLDSNPVIRKTYELNKKLVLDMEIPARVESQILAAYAEPLHLIDIKNLQKYFDFYKLDSCTQMFKELSFKTGRTVEWNTYNVDFDNAL